ncbi:MICOS complex subunit mic60 [Microbotryomycetes sp. JL221]|nr:MICOS complex subunit mic60 [Microbotryomycetes sp. JL221]
MLRRPNSTGIVMRRGGATAAVHRVGFTKSTTMVTSNTAKTVARRTYATVPSKSNVLPINNGTVPVGGTSNGPLKPKRSLTRRLLSPLLMATVIFYGVSVPLGYASLRYRDFLVEAVPLGEQIGDLLDKFEQSIGAKQQQEEHAKVVAAAQSSTAAPRSAGRETELTRYAESRAKAEGWQVKKPEPADPVKAREEAQRKKDEAVSNIHQAALDAKTRAGTEAKKVQSKVEDKVSRVESKAQDVAHKVADKAKDAAQQVKEAVPSSPKEVLKLEKVGGDNESKSTLPVYAQRPRDITADPVPPKRAPPQTPYQGPPLPLGFEPAPGYEVPRAPAPPKGEIKPPTPPPQPLPLVAPAVSDVTTSEPLLGQLASTIDSLAKFVENNSDNVSSSAGAVLSSAQKDIKQLATRLNAIKQDETNKLEQQLKKQANDYSSMLVKQEQELVERMDTQEQDWRKAFEDERKKLVDAYKTRLESELATQQEIINQRLKEEVVAQGIELQRRWVQEVKTRVEQERGGRLAKLEELEGGIRKLEKVAKENADTLGEAHRARKIATAVKAVEHAVASGRPFDTEMRALKSLLSQAVSNDDDNDNKSTSHKLLAAVLDVIPEDVSSKGISSFPSLASRFSLSVAPQLRKVATYPEHGGLLSYLTSVVTSQVMFERQGWSEGTDVLSTVARTKFWLDNKDLDMATREVNSLKGWPKVIATDWLKAARAHLEVKMALEVAEGEATAESLKAL